MDSIESILSAAEIRDFEGRPKQDIDLLFWIGGDFERVDLRDSAARTMEQVREQFSDWHVTLLVDGPEWAETASTVACGRKIQLSRAIDLPQALFALALHTPKLPWVSFAWPGSNPNASVLLELRAIADGADLAYAEGILPIPAGIPHPMQHGRLQMFDAVPMERSLLATKTAVRLPFDCSPVLQRLFWRDLVIRIGRHGRMASRACCPTAAPVFLWQNYPFANAVSIEPDTAARYVNAGNNPEAFVADLSDSEATGLLESCAAWSVKAGLQTPQIAKAARPTDGPRQIRVLVLGGIFEPHHNNLCFFRCFEKLRGQGCLTWRTKLYERCDAEHLRNYNLVIFTRPRYPGCEELMRECKAQGIGTIVMIDDNWISIGREYDNYKPLFASGQPQLETFLNCVRLADVTLVYNAVLAEDVAPYAREVVRLDPYIDPEPYAAEGEPVRGGPLLAGYSGSARPVTPAFPALADFAQRHREVDVLFMGPPLPPELHGIDPGRIHSAPFQISYEGYAKRIGKLRPDIMLAPLDDSRTSASKAPNKFLEISILGAAGIYSRVEPYTSYMRDGETGLLVDNVEQSWREALELLYAQPDLRRGIVLNAQREVRAKYTLDRAIPNLLRLFARAAK